MINIPSRQADAWLAERHAYDKLFAAFQTGSAKLIRMKVRAWQRIAARRRRLD
jgi:hypothetical protein